MTYGTPTATLQRKAGQPIEVISRVLGHASEMVALTIYNHWEGDLRAPADTMDLMLEKALVRHSLEELEMVECGPCGSRTHDTLIKSLLDGVLNSTFTFSLVSFYLLGKT